ncbi:MAG: hypothetical protein AVDCRST_MAG65-1638 [uncultured Solirubrobacteraceae bacterium]|uniref:Uncharacterized protein n=1 Tax=uncultured Solirubrobacteraceae bacterium TaxID=1162706 RepID=A0A6J4RYB9_9ACTN|nr:MAG: hypothetical protein AVDCRST_MAG65-1638 [uncultured Solirubrobacteraceae bacterium]
MYSAQEKNAKRIGSFESAGGAVLKRPTGLCSVAVSKR